MIDIEYNWLDFDSQIGQKYTYICDIFYGNISIFITNKTIIYINKFLVLTYYYD
jgi:hypothetical protein